MYRQLLHYIVLHNLILFCIILFLCEFTGRFAEHFQKLLINFYRLINLGWCIQSGEAWQYLTTRCQSMQYGALVENSNHFSNWSFIFLLECFMVVHLFVLLDSNLNLLLDRNL